MPEVLYGRNPVLEALRAGRRVRRLLVASGLSPDARVDEAVLRARSWGVEPEEAARPKLADIAHTDHHQGLVAYFDGRQHGGLEHLLRLVGEAGPPWPLLAVCLDGVQDPQNLGALARSAEALGAHALVVPRHRSAPLSAAAVSASAGALEHLRVVRVVNLTTALPALTELGVTTIGLDQDAELRCDEVDLRGPVALVVGSEGSGLHQLVRRRCDVLVRIPMGGRVASLNAAVAGAMLLYEVARQREFAFPVVG
ncbi:MAG: 23S rRNA (guanosine(2251)-2'-O)-methyltransferase RlmB [Candidatus Dormibacteria bacterium]